MTGKYILAIDQGTTSSRAILFDRNLHVVAIKQKEFRQYFPNSGWVEHDPEDIWSSTVAVCRQVLETKGCDALDVAAIGITNQRETVIVWDKTSGKPVGNAIVWQDRRTAGTCADLRAAGYEKTITYKTGLLLDPYFSGTKLAWILNNVNGARALADAGQLLFGTVDCFLIWRMTGGKSHVTDATNAARTMLYNIRTGQWDEELLQMLDIPASMMPKVKDCAAEFGVTEQSLFAGEIPILGVAGDQQAATIGQACFKPGMLKSTYGTGCFALMNTGNQLIESKNRLLGTIAYQIDGVVTYALEGSIFVAGAVVQWLRDEMRLITDAGETQSLADKADKNQDVLIVPAFTGLGAPYWKAECRGAVFGLTRNSGAAEMARAALESVGFQTRDLLEAMNADWDSAAEKPVLRVDGGMSANDSAMQFLADITGRSVDRPNVVETTALGVAWLAGMRVGFYPDQQEFAATWSAGTRFEPGLSKTTREAKYTRWKRAVAATISV